VSAGDPEGAGERAKDSRWMLAFWGGVGEGIGEVVDGLMV
jgi:hypothetical protein